MVQTISAVTHVGKPGRRRAITRPRCRWVDNTEVNFQEENCRDRFKAELDQANVHLWALVKAVMDLKLHKREEIP
jgi:hypothetical protein